MKLPETVTVGPHVYRVVVIPDGALGDAARAGQCNAQRGVIAIHGEQTSTQLADTVLHEITHALLEVTDLDGDVAERVALAMGPGLLALIRDNPELIRWVRGLR